MIRVALTFDNGPEPDVTPHVLDILAARGIKAHFFVLGHKVDTPAGRELVLRTLAEGHVVGNHSWSHTVPLGNDPGAEAVARELAATEAVLAPLSAVATTLFRPFGGGGVLGPHLLSAEAADYLAEHGYTCALWNSVPHDWDDPAWPARAHADCTEGAYVCMVLHDLPDSCLPALPTWLDEAAARGVEFVLEMPASCLPMTAGQGDLSAVTRR